MKQITLLALLTAGAFTAHAQTRFGITAGVGTSGIHVKNYNPDRIFMPSYRGGIMADIHLAGRFYVQPQLLVSTKGNGEKSTSTVTDYPMHFKSKRRPVYLELPVNVVYKHPLGSGQLIAGVGGYVARGIGGKDKSTVKDDVTGKTYTTKVDIDYKRHVNLATNPPNKSVSFFNPIDAGLNIMAGYELKNGLAFNMLYSPGLTSISPKTFTNYDGSTTKPSRATNSYIGISVSYLLPKRHNKA